MLTDEVNDSITNNRIGNVYDAGIEFVGSNYGVNLYGNSFSNVPNTDVACYTTYNTNYPDGCSQVPACTA